MATQATYYLDAVSLSAATVVYTDVDLTTVAADGFYSDGTITREQVTGALLPQAACPSCATPCGGSISGSGTQGVYYLNTDLGTDTGAIIIRFNPQGVPDGILATFNSVTYNGVSSPSFGWKQGSAGLPTYLGQNGACNLLAGSPYTLSEFEYNGTTFAPLGTTTSVPVVAGQIQLTATAPGNTLMVIPKTTASPSILDLEFVAPCSGTAFSIAVSCPAALTGFASTSVFASSVLACAGTINQTYYVARVNSGASTLGLYDLVFSDPNGQFKLAAGFYKTTAASTNDWFEVDANGAIIAFGVCATSLLRTFRVNNTAPSNSIELDVQVDSVQKISPTVIPANSVITLTPQVDCAGFTNVTLEYQLVSGYTPTSASFSNGSGIYTGTIAGGFITFTGVDLTANTTQDLTVNP